MTHAQNLILIISCASSITTMVLCAILLGIR